MALSIKKSIVLIILISVTACQEACDKDSDCPSNKYYCSSQKYCKMKLFPLKSINSEYALVLIKKLVTLSESS
jgi:hypothetical protein